MAIEIPKRLRVPLLLFALTALLTIPARAAALPDGPWDALPSELTESPDTENILAGGVSWLREAAERAVREALPTGVRSAVLLTLAALACGAAEGLTDGTGETAARYVPWCGVLAATTLAAGDLRAMIGLGAQTVDELSTLAKLLLPAMAASMASGGLVTAAGVWQVTTLMVCDALASGISRLLLPLVYCHIAASAAGAVLGEGRLELLADGIKKLITGALVAAMTAFTAYLSVAGVLTGSADRTAAKAAKLALSGAIPIVGGVVSDAAESVLAAAGTLRGTIGALGVFAILAACLTPLLRLGVQYVLYKAAAFASGIAGTKELGDYLDRLGEAFALMFAMTASCALVLLVALLIAVGMALG